MMPTKEQGSERSPHGRFERASLSGSASTGRTKPEKRSFSSTAGEDNVELEPIKNPSKATTPIVARGVNKLHLCVEQGFKDINAQLAVIRGALHIDEDGKRLKGATPIGMLSSWGAGWRGAVAIFAGISATLVIWRGLFELWPAISAFGAHFVNWMNTGKP